jgi:small subunit ribosomal protein S7
MTRRISTKKRFPQKDFTYNSFLMSLLINRILKKGKKKLARKIIRKSFTLLSQKSPGNSLVLFENAIRNISPRVQLKAKRVGGATYQVPTLLTRFKSINLAIRWLVEAARKRPGKGMAFKLGNELFDASKGIGNAIKKKEETHKMAEANKAFAQFR